MGQATGAAFAAHCLSSHDLAECCGHDLLDAVPTKLCEETGGDRAGLQSVDGFMQADLACGEERGAGLGARDEDGRGIDAASVLAERRGHGALPRRPRAAPSCEPREGRLLFGCSFIPNENSLAKPRVASAGFVLVRGMAHALACSRPTALSSGKDAAQASASARRMSVLRPSLTARSRPVRIC